MSKQKYENYCSCSDIEFTLRFECEETIEDFYCPFCGAALEEIQIPTDEDEDDYFE